MAWRSPSRPSSRRCGRRAGLRLGIAAGPDRAFLAHPDLEAPLLVDPAAGAVRDAGTLDQAVSWQCCHQVAARVLNRIGERADRVGNIVWALRAAELRLALPFDGADARAPAARPAARARPAELKGGPVLRWRSYP